MAAHEFRRVAIVNRGEAAMRFITAVREYNSEHRDRIETVALYTEPDRRAMFTREADLAYSLGDAMFVDDSGHRKSSYVDFARVEHALVETRADAVWLGWGFVAEQPGFVQLCELRDLQIVGPSSAMIQKLGDKISAKRIAEAVSVPVVPWSGGPIASVEEALVHADRLGYPALFKSTAGGGGRGIRVVRSKHDVASAFLAATAESMRSFGEGAVFLERLVSGARHVEVQVLGDEHGTTWALAARDCSIQRRNQKILEETPSPVLTDEQESALRESALAIARSVSYRSAGTVEFLYDEGSRRFWFMEVNARLQVEHPITEVVHGLDLVKLQLHIARGGRLDPQPPPRRGHAIEVRLNAEDPEREFAPAPGVLTSLRYSSGPGIRIDSGVEQGDSVPPDFDSMIAKLIAYGATREEAISRLSRALRSSAIEIDGGTTNKGFLLGLLSREELRSSRYDVSWMDRLVVDGAHVSRANAELAIARAAIGAYDVDRAVERARFFSAAARGRPEIGELSEFEIELSYLGHVYEVSVGLESANTYRVDIDRQHLELHVERFANGDERVDANGHAYRVRRVEQGLSTLVEVDGVPHRVSKDAGGLVRAPYPAVVVSVLVKTDDAVSVGTPIAVLEAMKMEMVLKSPFAGVVRDTHVLDNVQVPTGTPICTIEPPGEVGFAVGDRLSFESIAGTHRPVCTSQGVDLDELRSLMLGFDADLRRLSTSLRDSSVKECERREVEILEIFADVSSVLRRSATLIEPRGHSPEDFFFAYLRDLNWKKDQIPGSYVEHLRRALAHYGVASLERSEELESALFRLFVAHQRFELQESPIIRLLEARLQRQGTGPSERLAKLLDRLIEVTRDASPGLHDLARELKYRVFEKPSQDEIARRAHAAALQVLADGQMDRARRVRTLIESPYPLKALFSARFSEAGPEERDLMLESLTGRYYRIRSLEHPELFDLQGARCFAAEYENEGARFRVVSTHVEYDELASCGSLVSEIARSSPTFRELVIDLYAWRSGEALNPDTTARSLLEMLNGSALSRPIRRVVVAVSCQLGGQSQLEHFTFRQADGRFYEDRTFRGLHPMLSRRLSLWRLEHFNIERLPSAEDIYLFKMVGKVNEKDERLIALGEVRDVTAIRNEKGAVIAVPSLERALSEAFASIRREQSHRRPSQRLHWNRVHLFVWPALELPVTQINGLVRKLAPSARGLGIERVLVQGRFGSGERVLDVSNPAEGGLRIHMRDVPTEPMQPLSRYTQKVVQARSRGLVYPYEIVKMLTPGRDDVSTSFPPGEFAEWDLDATGRLSPVRRDHGLNSANVVVGTILNFTPTHPEGMKRVILLSDPSRGMGALAEPECRRINAALDLAEKLSVPLEWFAVSAGAKISMESGVENMDWIGAVLRRIIELTQRGGEINVVVCGINVGAQPYWNAEATMLMHTRGILIMTQGSSMVLTGKQALDYSGSVSAEDNEGVGGFERVMGPNGQAQYAAEDVAGACKILLDHYAHTYVAPGERFPRRVVTQDPVDRDVQTHPHPAIEEVSFSTVGDVFSELTNPGRKKPFDIRAVMGATIDRDHAPLERWGGMRDAETAVVWDAHVGGYAVCLLGIESRPIARFGAVAADGPLQWSSGTLFPMSSKKVARAINAASGNRPVVVLANLSGFDGSPESLRNFQLEHGAEIGRAVVNFDGPIVFAVISRYHGGAFVVFSNRLNDQLEVAALEGTYASVIGGAPAAAVVFAGELTKRTQADPRVQELEVALGAAEGPARVELRERLTQVLRLVRTEKLREVAEEFDGVHSVQRAQRVGAVQHILPPSRLRPYLVDAIERGMKKALRPDEKHSPTR